MRAGPASALDRAAACLEEAGLATWRRRSTVLAGAIAIGATLVFPVLAVQVIGWTSDFVRDLARHDRARVFLVDGATPDQVASIEAFLSGLPEVDSVEVVGPEEARQAFVRRFPELADVVAALPREDLPFASTVEFTTREGGARTERIVALVRDRPGVAEAWFDAAWSERLGLLLGACRIASAVVAALALGVTAFGVGTVVRMGALARREDLAIMRLVGAPGAHVRVPLWVEGLAQGVGGGLLAWAAVAALVRWLGPSIGSILPAAEDGLTAGTGLVLVAGAGLAGWIGAALGVESVLRRHARLER